MPKEWVLPEKQEDYAWARLEKISMMPGNRWKYEINNSLASNGQPLTSLGFGLNHRLNGKSKRRFWKSGLYLDRNIGQPSSKTGSYQAGLNLEPERLTMISSNWSECATKRMYPDVLSYDKIVELTGSWRADGMSLFPSFKVGRTRMVWK